MEHIVLSGVPVAVAVVGQTTWPVTAAATLVLILLLVAFGGFVYRSVTGDGIPWPDEESDETAEDEGVERGRRDDEWEYY